MRVNLYKIKSENIDEFIRELNTNSNKKSPEQKNNFKRSQSKIQFFLYDDDNENVPDWAWLPTKFNFHNVKNTSNPKAILVVKYKKNCFAYTFGTAFFITDKYCDREFSFNFARKIEYHSIKLTSKITPYSVKNKTIDSFISNDSLFFDSGEAYTKIKGKVKLNRDFNIFKEDIEIGTSIKFTLFENTIENLLNIIIYVSSLKSTSDKTRIPLLKSVSSRESKLLKDLDSNLIEAIKQELVNVSISEYEIKGTTSVFHSESECYEIRSGHKKSVVETLNITEINNFINTKGVEDENVLNMIVISKTSGNNTIKYDLLELIDYIDDTNQCVLISGKWYQFNSDYQEYLRNSINEIDVIYDPALDYRKSSRVNFVNKMYLLEKDRPEFMSKTSTQIKEILNKKYYRERFYNINLSDKNPIFKNYDRDLSKTTVGSIEIADVYSNEKDNETIFAVKIGNGSANLSYVIGQSEAALEIYRSRLVDTIKEDMPIKNIGIWLILDRATKLPLNDNKPDVNELDMFILKNRIDEWKKKVRLMGLNPIIRINYVIP